MKELVERNVESWELEEISTEEFETLANELLAWCGICCGGNGGPDRGGN